MKTTSSNTLNAIRSIVIVVDVKPYRKLVAKALELLNHTQQQPAWLIQN
jgi:hypothetical protein